MLKNEQAQNSLREQNKEEKLRRIEAAARKLFAKKGFDATTTREIAEKARIGIGTLFVYFPEKLDLLMHLYVADIERVCMGALDALPADLPLTEACARVFDALYEFYDADRALARVFVKELILLRRERQKELAELGVRFAARLGDLVVAAQKRGEVRADLVPPFVAHNLVGIYAHGLVNWL